MTKKYSFDDHPEHKEQLAVWRDKWIANAMSTKPMDDVEKAICREAVKNLYKAANLTPPPDHRIVFVPSPFVARFAGGFAAAIWYKRKNKNVDATDAATRAATDAATDAAADAATRAATDAATYAATRDATRDATDAATYAATRAATRDATDAATYAATDAATDAATRDATRAATSGKNKWFNLNINLMIKISSGFGLGKFGLSCAYSADRMYQGGNFWSAWDSFLTFFRHVSKLPLDYSKFDAWEQLALHSSYRIVHPEFCIISDRPEVLTVDGQNRPHNENGAFCQWRDGTALFSYHGVRVPEWVITDKNLITPELILKEENAEVRRVMAEIYGFRNFGQALIDSGKAKLISEQEVWGEPVRYYHFNDGAATMGFIHVINGTTEPDGTKHEFILTVKADNNNAEQAVFSTYPDLMERISTHPQKWDILRKSVRS